MAYTTIDDPTIYFNTVTYVANQTDDRQITVGFQPDWTWLKDRNQAVNHDLYDSVRGATKYISSNKTNAEGTQTDGLKSFNSTGFTLGTGWGNQSTGDDYVSWNWKAGGSASSNSNGSITSSVSASTDAGFSIVSFTSNGSTSTVGHGLGVKPDIYIIKNRSTSGSWFTYFTILDGSLDMMTLNTNSAKGDHGLSLPTSTVFSTDNGSNGNNMIAYCFAEKKGYSKFGSYTGNGNADGTFIYTGFKVGWLMVKKTSATEEWYMYDNKRTPFNEIAKGLAANLSGAEFDTGATIDFLSNGFKNTGTNTGTNASGETYIYMAFAESPFVTSTGIPTTAK